MAGPFSILDGVNPLAQAESAVHAVADGVQQQAANVSNTYDQDLKRVKESIESIKGAVADGTIVDRAGGESIAKFLGAMSGTTTDPKARELIDGGNLGSADVVSSLAGNYKPQNAPKVTQDMLQKLDGLHSENEKSISPCGDAVVCTSAVGHRDGVANTNGTQSSTEHPGNDYAPIGSNKHPDIVAAKSGVVVFVGHELTEEEKKQGKKGDGYGNEVVIMSRDENGNIEYRRYAHLDSIDMQNVKVGETVKQGEKIGVMGETGNAHGVHLHIEKRDQDFHVEPPDVDGKTVAKNQRIEPGVPADNSAVAQNKKPAVPYQPMPNGPTVDYDLPQSQQAAEVAKQNPGILVIDPSDPAKSYIGPQPAAVAENRTPGTPGGDKPVALNAVAPDAASKPVPDASLVAENQAPHPFEALLREWRESSPSANYVSPATGVKPQENTLTRTV